MSNRLPRDDRTAVTRRDFLQSLAAGVGAVGLGAAGFAGRAAATVPTTATFYNVRIVGQSPNEAFDRTGLLLVTPPVDATGANFPNGVNARDVALASGQPPGVPEAGAIWYASNTALYNSVGIPATTSAAALDVAFVASDEAAGLLQVVPDGPSNALAAQLNVFTARTSPFASIFTVIGGAMVLEFRNANREVVGGIDFVGVNPTGPFSAQSRYQAALAGTVAQVA